MVRLVPFTPRHGPQTFQWVTAPDLRRAMNYAKPISREDHESWVRRIVHQHVFAIEAEGRHVGNCCLKDVDPLAAKAELWIYIGPETDRRRGYGSRALQQLLEYGFEELALNRIYLYLVDGNEAAERMYRQAGFVREGRFRQHLAFEGVRLDAIFMGLLKRDWTGAQGER